MLLTKRPVSYPGNSSHKKWTVILSEAKDLCNGSVNYIVFVSLCMRSGVIRELVPSAEADSGCTLRFPSAHALG